MTTNLIVAICDTLIHVMYMVMFVFILNELGDIKRILNKPTIVVLEKKEEIEP